MKVLITPGYAKQLLAKNSKNRNINKAHVNFLANEITSGAFKYNGESIILSENGELLDGQHRLAAIIKSGISVYAELVEGVADNAMATINTGKKRMARDVLTINGFKNTSRLSSLIINVYKMNNKSLIMRGAGFNAYYKTKPLANHSILEIAQSSDYEKYLGSYKKTLGVTLSVLDLVNYVFRHISNNLTDDFMKKFFEGAMLESGDPVLALRNALIKLQDVNHKIEQYTFITLFFKAFEYYFLDKKITRLTGYSNKHGIPYPKQYPNYVDGV